MALSHERIHSSLTRRIDGFSYVLEFYTRPQSDQFYMINVLENAWLSVITYIYKHL